MLGHAGARSRGPLGNPRAPKHAQPFFSRFLRQHRRRQHWRLIPDPWPRRVVLVEEHLAQVQHFAVLVAQVFHELQELALVPVAVPFVVEDQAVDHRA